jgi:hypothetical protein
MRDLPALLDTPMQYVVEINDPPEDGRPATWDYWDLDRGATPHGYTEL